MDGDCPQSRRSRIARRDRGAAGELTGLRGLPLADEPRHRRPLAGQHPCGDRRRLRGVSSVGDRRARRLHAPRRAHRHRGDAARLRALPPERGRGVRREPSRGRRQHPRVARQFPGRDGRRLARAVRSPHADAGPCRRAGQRPRQRVLRLPAVPRLEDRPAIDRRGHDHGGRSAARRPGHAYRWRRGRRHRPRTRGPAGPASRHLAEYRDRPPEPGRFARVVQRVPQPARLLAPPGPPAGELRQVPPGPGPSAEGDIRRVEARRGLPRPAGLDEPRRRHLGARRGLFRGSDLRDLSHVGPFAQRGAGDSRSGPPHLLDEPAAGQHPHGHRRRPQHRALDGSGRATGAHPRQRRGQAGSDEGGLRSLPHAGLHRRVLSAVTTTW